MRISPKHLVALAGPVAVLAVLAGWAGSSLATAPKAHQLTGVVTDVDPRDRTSTVDRGSDAREFTVEDRKDLKARRATGSPSTSSPGWPVRARGRPGDAG